MRAQKLVGFWGGVSGQRTPAGFSPCPPPHLHRVEVEARMWISDDLGRRMGGGGVNGRAWRGGAWWVAAWGGVAWQAWRGVKWREVAWREVA